MQDLPLPGSIHIPQHGGGDGAGLPFTVLTDGLLHDALEDWINLDVYYLDGELASSSLVRSMLCIFIDATVLTLSQDTMNDGSAKVASVPSVVDGSSVDQSKAEQSAIPPRQKTPIQLLQQPVLSPATSMPTVRTGQYDADWSLDLDLLATALGPDWLVSDLTDQSSDTKYTSPSDSSASFGHIRPRCDLCKTTFDCVIDLRQHNEQSHGRFHHCIQHCRKAECTKSFTEARSLKRHARQRTIPCPYHGCEYSKRAFKRHDYLLKHIRRRHTQLV